jgi:tRNA-(ms[2]io[6]A)-hydroxylase
VLEELKKRGYAFGRQRKDEYVEALMKQIVKGGSRDHQLVERLLVNALIEARSCERFKILWKNIPDEELSKFYYSYYGILYSESTSVFLLLYVISLYSSIVNST